MTDMPDKCAACPRASSADVKPGVCPGCRREPRGKLVATNWLSDISSSADFNAVQVVFKNTRTGFYANPDNIDLKIGDIVAVEAAPGHDIGRVSMVGRLVRIQMKRAGVKSEADLKRVFRIARQADLEKFEEARSKEHDTMIRSRKIAEELELNMKIGDVEYQGDGAKAIFYYIADERVDFRKLIRILADTFKVRVEMKQIGARQEAGRIGGIGPCGRPLCCSSWMSHFVSVGTGSARVQDLSMNPQKLAGQCAKLKCCLNFEADAYAEAVRQLPPKDVALETKDATYYYFKPDIMTRKVTYSTDRNIPANLVTIDARRAFEIIALNKQGVKVDSLDDSDSIEEKPKEFVDLVGQESLTRFDRSKKRKKKKKPQLEGKKSQPEVKKPQSDGKKMQQEARRERPEGKREQPQRETRKGQGNAMRQPKQPKRNDIASRPPRAERNQRRDDDKPRNSEKKNESKD